MEGLDIFALVGLCNYEFTGLSEGDVVGFASCIEKGSPLKAELRLKRILGVVQPCVDDLRVART